MIFIFFNIYFEARIMSTGLNVALTLLYQYLKKNLSIQLYFSTYRQKSILEIPITVFNIFFFSKTTGDIHMNIGIESRTCTRSFQQNSEKNLSKTYIIFLRKCNLLKTGTCTFVAITQWLKLFWQNLLGNYYSILHNLSSGI